MGCQTSNPQARRMLKVQTPFGGLNVTVLHLDLQQNNDVYVKIVMSNQYKSTSIVKKQGFKPVFNHLIVIPVNSCYKPYGRSLEIFVLAKKYQKDKMDTLLAYGIVDLDRMIYKEPNQKQTLKIALENQFKDIGFAYLDMEFKEEPNETISFRFETVNIRIRNKPIMNCWVKITVGQQILQTPQMPDTVQLYPYWSDQEFMVEFPKCIETVKLEVYDEKVLLGKVQLSAQKFVNLTEQTAFEEEIKKDKVGITGTLFFSVVRGKQPVFKQYTKSYSKIAVKKETIEEREKAVKQREAKQQIQKQKQMYSKYGQEEGEKQLENIKFDPKKQQPNAEK